MISVVIPTKNSQRTLLSCLQSIESQSYPDYEIIVVDNGSTDGTQRIARDAGAQEYQFGPERNAQRNFGLLRARGEIVVFIDSDMVLEPSVLEDIAAAFLEATDLVIVVIPESSFGCGKWARAKVFEKSLVLGDPQVEAARAFRTQTLIDFDGWDESRIAAEDWELTDRLIQHGAKISRIGSHVWHNEGKPSLLALFRKKGYYGRDTLAYLRHNSARRSGLTQRFINRRVIGRLIRDPISTFLLVITKATETLGVVSGGFLFQRTTESVYLSNRRPE